MKRFNIGDRVIVRYDSNTRYVEKGINNIECIITNNKVPGWFKGDDDMYRVRNIRQKVSAPTEFSTYTVYHSELELDKQYYRNEKIKHLGL